MATLWTCENHGGDANAIVIYDGRSSQCPVCRMQEEHEGEISDMEMKISDLESLVDTLKDEPAEAKEGGK